MSTRYLKGERFRVRSTGFAPQLHVDTSTQQENANAVASLWRAKAFPPLYPSNCCGAETNFVARLGAKDRRRCRQCGSEQNY